MNLYLWKRVGQVSDNWHCEGGLVVIAEDEAQARSLIEAEELVEVDADEWGEVVLYQLKHPQEPQVITFPDAGCC